MGDDSGECLDALANRLFRTWTIRCGSATTRGRSGGRSMRTAGLPPPLRNVCRACSTRPATAAGSGTTDSVPASMRPASSRSPIRPRMWSACSSMIRKNCTISAGSRAGEAPRTVAAEPLMEVSGARSSWLTMPRNSARNRSSSSSGARSCRVKTTDSTSPPAERMGVALMSILTLRPPGAESAISSARTVSPLLDCQASESSARDTSRPSARWSVSACSSSSSGRSGGHSPSTIRLVS